MIEHALGVGFLMGSRLDAKVAEHSVGFPAAHEADVVGVNIRQHECCGTSRAE